MSGLEQWGLQVVLWFQSWRNEIISAAAFFFHVAGGEDVALVLLPVIYWCIDEAFGRRLTLLFALNIWINGAVKDLLARPRPYEISTQVKPLFTDTSRGIPSGHAQNATTLWGLVAMRVKKGWVTGVVILYILLTAISRMVAGVHFPQDVIAGVLIGCILLGLYAWLEPMASRWVNSLSMWGQIGVVVGVCAVMFIVHPLIIPASDPESSVLTAMGAVLGGGIGLALETHTVRFSAQGDGIKRVLRFIVGIAVLIGLRFGLKAAFETLEPAVAFRILRYAIIGLWMAYAAPWVFVRTGLAEQKA